MKKKILFIYTFFKLVIYSEEFEIGLYSFTFNEKIKSQMEKVYIFENKKIYIDLIKFLKTIEITNNKWVDEEFRIDVGDIYNQEKTINLKNKRIISKSKKIIFESEILEKNNSIYVELDFISNVIDLKKIEKNDEQLTIKFETDFILPIEYKNIREYKKRELEENNSKKLEEKNIYSKKKLFEVGNLRTTLNYQKNFQDSSYETKWGDIEYQGLLLYGNFETYNRIYPDVEHFQTRLTYNNVYEDHSIIFGDTYSNIPSIISKGGGNIRGITFRKNRLLREERSMKSITIKGEAPLGKFVELYQNNELLSYENVEGGEYIFKDVPLVFSSDAFSIIIYNLDGSITRENLQKNYNYDLENKGDFGFNIQAGEATVGDYKHFIGEVNYGLTETLTLKTGYYDFKYSSFYSDFKLEDEKIWKIGALYVSDYTKNPYTLDIEVYGDGKEIDSKYEYSRSFKEIRLEIEGANYSKKKQKQIKKERELKLRLDKENFMVNNISLGLRYFSTEYLRPQKSRDEIGVVLRDGRRYFSTEYGIYKDVSRGDIFHDFGVRSSYFRNISLYAGVSHTEINNFDGATRFVMKSYDMLKVA